MKEDILQRLVLVINALNSVSVSGKQNLGNLSGSIAMLEEIHSSLSGVNFEEVDAQSDTDQ